jgi:hygromycin-B 4-O-kinase
MLRLAVHCPEERVLIHNDFWFENVLSEGERITGVIDWANALYGDPLYEVARLSWGAAWPGWWYDDGVMLLRERFGSAPGYAERLACYQCHIGLDDLRFYANTRRRTEYDFFRARLLTLIATQQA